MVVLINIGAELTKLKSLQGLTPQTSLAEGEGFARLAPYRDSMIFAFKASGKTWWERHPDGEEFVLILEGAATIDIITSEGSKESYEVCAGMIAIIPKGLWHQARFSAGMSLISVTPTHTDFIKLDVDDPRDSMTNVPPIAEIEERISQ